MNGLQTAVARAVYRTDPEHPSSLRVSSKVAHRLVRRLPSSRGPYNLTISHEDEFVWFRVGKAGTRSMLHLLRSSTSLDCHESFRTYWIPSLFERYLKFAFVRDPMSRSISCWQNRVVRRNYFGFPADQLDVVRNDFSEWVTWLESLDLRQADNHIRLQTALADVDHLDFVGQMENFADDVAKLFARLHKAPPVVPHQNKNTTPPPTISGDAEVRLRALYEEDYLTFGYPT